MIVIGYKYGDPKLYMGIGLSSIMKVPLREWSFI